MVSGQDNQRILIEFLLSEESQHAAHLRISKSNLAIVGLCFVLLIVGSRRPVGVMRIIQMDPEEKTLGVVVAQPGQALVDHHITRALHGVEVCLIKPAERSEEHTSELQSPCNLVCRLLLEKKKIKTPTHKNQPNN